jgi:uncharacterized protein YggU (UPF0235/DUF167 family)
MARTKIIKIKVHPSARVNKVVPDDSGGYTVWTTATAEKGKANDAVIKALAKHLSLAPSLITLVRGASSRQKQLAITFPDD